jgi:methionine-gamma-lyase
MFTMKDYRRRDINGRELKPESLMMSYGYDPMLSEGAVKPPIFQTSTFAFENAEAGKAFFEIAYGLRVKGPTEELGLIYSRLNNPDLEVLEDRLTLWDQAEAAAVFQSGMAAIATTLLSFVRPGDVLIASEPLYGGSDYLIKHVLPEFGVTPVCFHAGLPIEEAATLVRERAGDKRVSAALIETPANPTNALVDIQGTAEMVHSFGTGDHRPVLIVDNTFLGPVFQHPIKHGADLVVYSATKFIGGHSDVIAGACLGSQELMTEIKTLRTFVGTMADPWSGWLLLRSLETLKMRMTAMMKNAQYVADYLADHPKVRKVHYLGLLRDDDPMFDVYRRQCSAPGSLIAFEVEGGEATAFRFLNSLQLVKLAVSLGGTESLAEHPATMTHSDVPPEDQVKMGITSGMVRMSVGVEHYEDIIADLDQALASV